MDVAGWQETRWGMTSEEVIVAINSKDLVRTNREEYYQAYSDLILPHVKIGEFSFDAIFQMNAQTHGLSQVVIRHDGDLRIRPKKAFAAALELLTERFGRSDRIGTSENLIWNFITTTITLNMIFIEQSLSIVSVHFQPTAVYEPPTTRSAF